MRNTNDFSNVVAGDKLWSIKLGDCVVTARTTSNVIMKNDSGEVDCYRLDGKYTKDSIFQSLFFSNPDIIAPEEPVKIPDLKVDDKVLVRDSPGNSWFKMHFSSFDNKGGIYCFAGGRTSFTAKDITHWDEYRLVE